MPKILVIGESGQLARSLRNLHWRADDVLVFHGSRSIGAKPERERVLGLVRAERPHMVLNAAAYTAVDRAESDAGSAAVLNAELPAALAEACAALDVPLVHISTDYVFDGSKRSPYLETDAPNPLCVYGRTKLDGDRAIATSALRSWAILRTSWVVSEIGETFPVKLLRRIRSGEPLSVVDDQHGCPTAAGDLARAMQEVGTRLLAGDRSVSGLLNFRGGSEMTWHGFAEKLVAASEAAGLRPPPLRAISSVDLKAPARRPSYSVLSCARIERECGIVGWRIEADLARMVRAILAA